MFANAPRRVDYAQPVTFDEVVSALEALAADEHPVSASVWGVGSDAAPLMDEEGVLRRMPESKLPGELHGHVGEEAVVFLVGDGSQSFSLWPSRFAGAEIDDLNGIEIRTRDGLLRVRRNRPWID